MVGGAFAWGSAAVLKLDAEGPGFVLWPAAVDRITPKAPPSC